MASLLEGIKFGKPYTIGELMNIDSGRQQKAMQCNVKLIKTYHELKQESLSDKVKGFFTGKQFIPVYFMTFKFEVTSPSGTPYLVYIKTNPDFSLKNWASNRVEIYCECADFKYRSAYILNKRGSLFHNMKIASELGEAMTDAPKRGATLLCKHSFAALNWLMNNWSSIMRTA